MSLRSVSTSDNGADDDADDDADDADAATELPHPTAHSTSYHTLYKLPHTRHVEAVNQISNPPSLPNLQTICITTDIHADRQKPAEQTHGDLIAFVVFLEAAT